MADQIESALTELEQGTASLIGQHDKHQSDIKRIMDDRSLSDEGKQAGIAQVQAEIPRVFETRDALAARVDELTRRLAGDARRVTRAARPEPKTVEELSEVNQLITLYERDFESVPADQVAQEFGDLLADGRKWAAWAWHNVASRKLADNPDARAALDRAALAAWPVDTARLSKITGLQDRARQARARLAGLRSDAERREFADTYGLKPEFVP